MKNGVIPNCGPGSGDGGNCGEYATLALIDLAELWEADRPCA